MSRERDDRHESGVSRRTFLTTTGGAVAGAAAYGLVGQAEAANRHPKRGGMLRFATRGDSAGIDPHRNLIYLVSDPLAAMAQGLLDLNLQCEPVPGIATEWTMSNDLLTYTFNLRQGALFHNGREIDAAAIKWNFDRLQNPKTSHSFARATLGNLKETIAVDKYTVRCVLEQPSATFLSNVVYYPCHLMAPDSAHQSNEHPIGCGPFKFVSWQRYETTKLVRFENYYETDAAGNNLPYLDGIVGLPKKEDTVRLTSLRAGEVDLIDNMAYTDAAAFPTRYAGQFQTWDVQTLGTSFILFNLEKGPFADKQVRQAAAYAIDHAAIKSAVFSGRGAIATSYYSPVSPWHMAGTKPYPEYDPDKAKALLKKAHAMGAEIDLQSSNSYAYLRQTADLLQAMWTEVGFKANHSVLEGPVLKKKRQARDFHAQSASASYRFDPDGWFSHQFLSTAASNEQGAGFHNDKVDQLIGEARVTVDKQKRLELYTAIESIVNDELPILYIHHLTLLAAGVPNLNGYQPAISGPFSTHGNGIRTAWLA